MAATIARAINTDTLPMETSVMIVEDEPEFRQGFAAAIASDPRLRLQAAVDTVAAARAELGQHTPDVLMVDIGLPDASGIELIRHTAHHHPQTDCLVVTIFGDDAHVLACIEAGATGYLLKDALAENICACIHQLRAGGSPISPGIARRVLARLRPGVDTTLPPAADNPLTRREADVLRLVAKGLSFDEVGATLHLSPHTIVAHVKNIYRKLAVHSRGEAVFEAGRMGLL